ncbi:MAG: hypothetical protein RRZ38_12345, partial [Hafnia sp.]
MSLAPSGTIFLTPEFQHDVQHYPLPAEVCMSQQWSSRIGHILAAAGSAIGIGAIWKFPYVSATNGGGA